jgi:hypothetical protein
MDLRQSILEIIAHANRVVAEQPEEYNRAMAAYFEPEPSQPLRNTT